MALVKFTATCLAYYKSSLDVPNEVIAEGNEKIAQYLRDNIGEANVDELTWLQDTEDCVTQEDIVCIEEVV